MTRAAMGFALAALAGMALFAALGVWQLGRGQEKQALLAAAETVLQERKPVPLTDAADSAHATRVDWAEGSGTFSLAEPLLLDNQTRGGRAGVRVYRIFLPDTANADALLVDLGWLPLDAERKLPLLRFVPRKRVELRGLLVTPPSTGLAMGSGLEKVEGGWLLTRVDLDVIAAQVNGTQRLAPRVLRLDPAMQMGYERDLVLLPNTLPPSRHFGYAATWFALAATVAITYVILQFRSRRKGAV